MAEPLPELGGIPSITLLFYAIALALLLAARRRSRTQRQRETAWQE